MDYKDFDADDFARDAFFIRWVKGEPKSQWFWSTFLKEHPSKANDIEKAREMVEAFVAVSSDDVLHQEVRESMRNQLRMSLKARKERQNEHAHSLTSRRWMGIAASFALLISSVSILYWSMSSPDALHTGKIIGERSPDSISTDSTELRINPRGQKSVMLLADGTKVWLNADTKLTYAKNFGEHDLREVYLEGEAFFEVMSDPDKPFIVHTSELNIKVLGTSFNVKSYAEDGHIETTLVEGKVEVDKRRVPSGSEGKVILKPNQRATFSKESHDIDVEEVVADEAVAWRRDRLVFKSESLSEVIKQLERWYNVKIHVENAEDLSCPLTANIEKESLSTVLDLLAVTHNISFTINGKEVLIKGSVCH